MCVNSNDTTPILLGNVIINPTDKYVYLGAPILNSEIEQQIELQLQQNKRIYSHRFYPKTVTAHSM